MKSIIGVIVLSSAVLTGCVSVSNVALPGGGQGFAIKCGDPKQCYNKAAEVCAPAVYELAATNTTAAGAVVNGTGSVDTQTTLIVRCKSQ